MTITQHISIDLQQPGNMPMVHAVQGDEYTRKIEIELYSNGVSWNPPDGCDVAIRYGKPDGKGGIYAVLPDNTPAYSIAGNAITVTLAPQMVTVPGVVEVQVSIIKDRKDRLSTFSFAVDVEADPSKGELKSENYVNWKSYYIPQTTGASVGQYLEITKVDEDGQVIGVKAVDAPSGGGIGENAANLLITILRAAVYSTDQSANIADLQAALAAGGGNGGDVTPPETPPENPPETPPETTEPVYQLEQATTFDGETTIDTGYNLFDRDKDWSVCLTAKIANGAGYAFSAKAGSETAYYPAIGFRRSWAKYSLSCYGFANNDTGFEHNADGFKVVLTRTAGAAQGKFVTMHFVKGGTVVSYNCTSNVGFTPIADSSIILGGCVKEDGSIIDKMQGEISDFRVYEKVMDEAEIKAYLEVTA